MKIRIHLWLCLILLIVISVLAWKSLKDAQKTDSELARPTPSKDVLPQPQTNRPYSYGRVDECCFKGWAYDEDNPITYKFVLENIDYPEIKRVFSRTNSEPQTEFYFADRGDAREYLRSKGVTKITNKVGFTFSPQELLYPGRYRLGSATYNEKRMDTNNLTKDPLFTVEWTGAYERRYNPSGYEYIEHKENFDVLHDQTTKKEYAIKPRPDLVSTSNARWSPDAKHIAYTYNATPSAKFQ